MASLFAVDLQSRWPDNQSGQVVSYPVVHRSMLDHACLLVAGGGGGGGGGCTQRRVAWTRLRRIEDAKENQLAGQTVSTVRLFARARERDSSNVFRISEHGMYVYKPGTPPLPVFSRGTPARALPSFMFATGATATDTDILVTLRVYPRICTYGNERIRNSTGD